MRSKRKEHVVPKFPICKSATVKQQHSRIILSEAYCTNECDSKAFEFKCSKKELMNPPQLPVCPSVCLSVRLFISVNSSLSLSIRESNCLFTYFFTMHYFVFSSKFVSLMHLYVYVWVCVSVCVCRQFSILAKILTPMSWNP